LTASRTVLWSLATALLAACYGGPGTDSPVVGRAFPPGVLAPAAPAPGPTGIYTAQVFGAYNCCWLAQRAAFATTIPGGRAALRVMVSLPPEGPYAGRPETLAIAVDGARPKTFANLRGGIYALDLPLAARGTARDAAVRIEAGYGWTPPGFPVPLSVQLRGVRALPAPPERHAPGR
jgi:hypothetical protein